MKSPKIESDLRQYPSSELVPRSYFGTNKSPFSGMYRVFIVCVLLEKSRVTLSPLVELHIVLGLGAAVLLHLFLDMDLVYCAGLLVDAHGLGDLLYRLSLAEEMEVLGFSGGEHKHMFTQEEG